MSVHNVNVTSHLQVPDFGVMYLFYSLILDKCYADPINGRVSNMESVALARNREQVREQILSCIRTPIPGRI